MKTKITDLEVGNEEARDFFLRPSSFCNIGLPKYFDFENLLKELKNHIKDNNLKQIYNVPPQNKTEVNCCFFRNKDGRFDWRPLQIINPAIYVCLVNCITDERNWEIIKGRFNNDFAENEKIECYSVPLYNSNENHKDTADSIMNWWTSIEQKTLEYTMEYNYLLTTDITDCYGSIYTHSIAWAMCGKETAKTFKEKGKEKKQKITEEEKTKYEIGDQIDTHIRSMSNGQTNGIPQGSVLMDFIAEMVLGYADLELSAKINEQKITIDYKILRYRDDYRIFGKTQEDVIKIAKLLSEVLSELNFRLNTAKTSITQDIISGAIKPDKLYYITKDFKRLEDKNSGYTLQKQLLRIYKLSLKCPNSGMLQKSFEIFFKRLCEKNNTDIFKEADAAKVMISIVTNIAYNNPKVYKTAIAIIGKILSYDTDENAQKTYNDIIEKFKGLPNVGYLEIWLQRLTIKSNRNKYYTDKLCRYAAYPIKDNIIWNIEWLKPEIQKVFENNPTIKESEIENMPNTIEYSEIETFSRY